jgi:hypothetical protein
MRSLKTGNSHSVCDVSAEMLEKAVERLTLGRNAIRLLDGAGPTVQMSQSGTTGQERGQEAEAGEASAKDSLHHDKVGETQRAVPSTNCSFQDQSRLRWGDWWNQRWKVCSVRLGKHSETERAIRGDDAASSAKIAASVQCHTLDGVGN